MKGALIVCPSYRFTGDDDDKKTQKLLARLNLLPSELGKYNTEADIHRLRSLLQSHGFTCVVLSGQVDASTVGTALERMLTANDIALFAFCGHGSAENSSYHGAMLLSDNVRLSSFWMNGHLAGFSGTFIMLLNMCHAAGNPPIACNSALQPRGGIRGRPIATLDGSGAMHQNLGATFVAAQPGLLEGAQRATLLQPQGACDAAAAWGQEPVALDCKRISIFASSATENACGNASGSAFVEAIVGILSESDCVRYESFGQRLAAARSDRDVKSAWIYHNTYTGRFFGPAIDKVRDDGRLPRRTNDEDVISTSNLVWNYA